MININKTQMLFLFILSYNINMDPINVNYFIYNVCNSFNRLLETAANIFVAAVLTMGHVQ